MYFIDRNKIEQKLSFIEHSMDMFENQRSWSSPIERLALERLVHLIIEAIIDVGNGLIDGFIMRDPGSYEDIINILEDETVITKEEAPQLKQILVCRKMVVQTYLEIDHDQLEQALLQSLSALRRFPDSVRRYLDEELGPVSAFLPSDQ
jgi:uncharacterized protein YutE (UPF0331/DUF86 family)